ncbi:Transducin/WD40 repeat-like superfamily protein isoform 1 [Tripterygium wilfordii]|uniref:Transducin/WD40 repeat-like superfamily protein isoform 1 n=1 Tax=Tripterygium wilfordii TaxID=458696 RepID=A0A7J7CAT8_TRIWF|nr:Transducin/WD40 repeat-like superfamily protein isoform 1 [Tripterygium wilfordii]
MENMQYADELVREFLVVRGFTNTLEVFETDLGTDIGKSFQISSEKKTVNLLKKDVEQLNQKLLQLQTLLEEKEAQLCQMRMKTGSAASVMDTRLLKKLDPEQAYGGRFETISGSIIFETTLYVEGGVSAGHTSSIRRFPLSASGNNIASASIDATIRIWTYEPSTSASRNATIYCGAEDMSLDWDFKSDRMLLIGTADGGIKAWNVDAKRVVCDLNTDEAFPRALEPDRSPYNKGNVIWSIYIATQKLHNHEDVDQW